MYPRGSNIRFSTCAKKKKKKKNCHNFLCSTVGLGDSSHHATRGDSSLSPFRGEKPENQKTVITIRKGRLLLVNDQGFSQIALT